jgi:hypothetical protein
VIHWMFTACIHPPLPNSPALFFNPTASLQSSYLQYHNPYIPPITEQPAPHPSPPPLHVAAYLKMMDPLFVFGVLIAGTIGLSACAHDSPREHQCGKHCRRRRRFTRRHASAPHYRESIQWPAAHQRASVPSDHPTSPSPGIPPPSYVHTHPSTNPPH